MKRAILSMTVVAFALFSMKASAQVSATATANATAYVVTPLTITTATHMNFGLVAPSSAAGTVVLGTDGSRTFGGGATQLPGTGTVSAASFNVAGEPGYTYAISLPASVSLANGGNTIVVDNFTSNPSGTGLLTGGVQTLNVGATLEVTANIAPGNYTTATPFNVTVNYN
ncbi:uncharacterized protein DUF4402 [Chitinophaga dinghuensis]|uniref:Uncharacterized protein DUF4402 n=1 Tax=Chitinophaga dinghuensis TaxID=1539050 RepID=A0A327W192_9BACT|nr:DUF4402 domain-containing protein [Chitinophaga dinghuensis]RAJ82026.1 uncharacterized protein DUF4402 [Chitinophaga dinghuensis]